MVSKVHIVHDWYASTVKVCDSRRIKFSFSSHWPAWCLSTLAGCAKIKINLCFSFYPSEPCRNYYSKELECHPCSGHELCSMEPAVSIFPDWTSSSENLRLTLGLAWRSAHVFLLGVWFLPQTCIISDDYYNCWLSTTTYIHLILPLGFPEEQMLREPGT